MKMEAILPVQLLPRQRLRRRQQQLPQIPAVHLAVPQIMQVIQYPVQRIIHLFRHPHLKIRTVLLSEADSKGNSVGAVETGDNTPILPFVIIGIAAAVIVAVLVYLKKKK